MYSKRQEGFRYQFGTPHPCTFELISINGQPIESKQASAHIHDISPHGLNLRTKLDIPIEGKKVGLRVTFVLNTEEVVAEGYLMWRKKEFQTYSYGMRLQIDISMERFIVDELKKYTKKLRSVTN